jgi:hypothetical protein
MNAVAMLEGRRLFTKLAEHAYGGDEEIRWRTGAVRGSTQLRDAILLAKGIAPPALKEEPRPFMATREEAHKPAHCPFCNGPFKPSARFIAHIQETVSAYYGLNPLHMISAERGATVARPRQIAMYLARELSGKSLPDIGRRFGNRDHTTVMHAVKAVQRRMYEDAEVLLDVEVLRERLGE